MDYTLGGEQSGHVVTSEHGTTGRRNSHRTAFTAQCCCLIPGSSTLAALAGVVEKCPRS